MKNEGGFAGQTLSTALGAYRYDGADEDGDDLYFVRSADGFCKIGRSGNVKSRFATLRNANPHPLYLELHLASLGWQEKVWHRAFCHLRVEGEWFKWSPDLSEAIEAARLGDEWIATLTSPRPARHLSTSGWAFQVQFLEDQSPRSVADFLWRNYIADMEEDAAEGHLDGPCPYCDGTGDVHRIDGEWLGECDCMKPPPPAASPCSFEGEL